MKIDVGPNDWSAQAVDTMLGVAPPRTASSLLSQVDRDDVKQALAEVGMTPDQVDRVMAALAEPIGEIVLRHLRTENETVASEVDRQMTGATDRIEDWPADESCSCPFWTRYPDYSDEIGRLCTEIQGRWEDVRTRDDVAQQVTYEPPERLDPAPVHVQPYVTF